MIDGEIPQDELNSIMNMLEQVLPDGAAFCFVVANKGIVSGCGNMSPEDQMKVLLGCIRNLADGGYSIVKP